MSRVGFSLLLLVVIAVLSQDVGRGAAPLRSVVRLDAYGDPLPPGAIARMGTVRFWHPSATSIAYSRDGKELITRVYHEYRVWDPATGKELRHVRIPPTTYPSDESVYSDDDNWHVSPCGKTQLRWERLEDQTTRMVIRDARTRKNRQVLNEAHFWDQRFEISSDGAYLAIPEGYARDGVEKEDLCVHLWDLRTRKKLAPISGFGRSGGICDFLPGSHLLFVRSSSRSGIWDVDTGKEYLSLGNRCVTSLLIARDTLIVSNQAAAIEVWDVPKRHLRKIFQRAASAEYRGRVNWHDTACLAPDGSQLAVLDEDGRVLVWDWKTGKELTAPTHPQSPADHLFIAPDGKHVVGLWAKQRSLRIFQAETGLEKVNLRPAGTIEQVKFVNGGEGVLLFEKMRN